VKQGERRVSRIWYWAILNRASDGRTKASIPDLGDLAACGANEKDAVARAAEFAGDLLSFNGMIV
jgi:hypothetical protein